MTRWLIIATGMLMAVAAGAQTTTPVAPEFSGYPTDTVVSNPQADANYDRLVAGDSSFRSRRARQECDPISDPDLRAQCLASFAGVGAAGIPSTGGTLGTLPARR